MNIKVPKNKVNDLREIDELAFNTVTEILYGFAVEIYEVSEDAQAMGLEKTLETIIELVDKGLIKICVDEDEIPQMSIYDPELGGYRLPDEEDGDYLF